MRYRIEYMEKVVKKDIPSLSSAAKKSIKKAIEEKLEIDPIAFGKPLRYGLYGQRRLRVGDYMVVFTLDYQNKVVTINTIGHRKDVYE